MFSFVFKPSCFCPSSVMAVVVQLMCFFQNMFDANVCKMVVIKTAAVGVGLHTLFGSFFLDSVARKFSTVPRCSVLFSHSSTLCAM